MVTDVAINVCGMNAVVVFALKLKYGNTVTDPGYDAFWKTAPLTQHINDILLAGMNKVLFECFMSGRRDGFTETTIRIATAYLSPLETTYGWYH